MDVKLLTLRNQLKDIGFELLKKKNVVATGIGYKVVDGKVTSDLAIICSVETKQPIAKLHAVDQIPPFIQDIPTDVKSVGLIRALENPQGRFRPAPGGVSIGHFDISAGTLGCLVKKDDDIYILSNNHVLANSNDASAGDIILQPAPFDGGNADNDLIAELSDFIPLKFENENEENACYLARGLVVIVNGIARLFGSKTRLKSYNIQQVSNFVDCALAKPLSSDLLSNELLGIGVIDGIQEGTLGLKIKKSGRTTGLTSGSIEQIDVSVRVNYGSKRIALFTDQILAGSMSEGGDSGSAVVSEDNKLVGLLFAGSTNTTIINPITYVLDALNVTLV